MLRVTPVLLFGLLSLPAQSQSPAAASPVDAAADQRLRDWREDLAFFATELPARHKNAFFQCKEADFAAAVAALEGDLPRLADHEVVVRLMQLAAKIGDFHTGIGLEALPQPAVTMPFAVALFADGPIVVAARAAQKDMIGCSLVRIGAVPWRDALRRVASVVGYENESTWKQVAPRFANNGHVLHAVGLTAAPDAVRIAVRDAAGAEREFDLTPLQQGEQLTIGGPEGDARPLYRRQHKTANWFEALPDRHAVYLHYWRCADEPGQRVAELGDAVLEAVEEPGVERLIVDLRGNGGGNSALLMPFVQRLASRENVHRPGGIVVLVGRGTFSSAHLNAMSLRNDLGAVLIGEPTGQKPNAYGEVKSFALPHSKIQVRYSTKFWKTEDGDRPSTDPDVTIEPTSADFFAGRDPVLEAALAYVAK